MTYGLVAQDQQRRQDEDDQQHADNSAAREQHAHGADDVDIRVQRDAEGRGEQSHAADQYRGDRRGERRFHAFLFIRAAQTLRLVARRHQDRVVDGRTQLDGADTDRSDKRQRLTEIMRQTEVDEDTQLDDRDQDERQGDAALDQHDDDEDRDDGYQIDDLEVVTRRVDHILHARRFTDQHRIGIIAVEDLVEAVDLRADRVARAVVFTVDQHKLVFVVLQNIPDMIGQYFFRDGGAEQALDTEDLLDAVDLLHLGDHALDLFAVEVRVHQHHMRRADIVILTELGVGDHELHVLGQTLRHVVVDLAVRLGIAVEERRQEQDEDHQKYGEYLHDTSRQLLHIGDQGFMMQL